MRTIVVCLLSATLTLSAAARRHVADTEFAIPAGADLDRFPIKQRALTVAEQAELGVTAKKLEAPLTVQNHWRNLRDKDGRFELETLLTGTLVLVDKDGKPRYKANCGNRIVELQKCPVCSTTTGSIPVNKNGSERSNLLGGNTKKDAPTPGFWQRLTDGLRSAAMGLWNFIGGLFSPFWWLLAILAGILLLIALLGLLAWLIRRIIEWFQNRRRQEPEPIVPPPAVRPLAQNPPVVPPAPPAGANAAEPPQAAQVAANPPAQPNQPPAGNPAGMAPRSFSYFGGDGRTPTHFRYGRNVTQVHFNQTEEGGTEVRFIVRP